MELTIGQGGSLFPLIETKSILGIVKETAKLHPGDLALYTQNKKIICHLVLFTKIESGMHWYFFKGNSILEVDGWIPEYRLIGKVATINGTSVNNFRFLIRKFYFYFKEILRYSLFLLCFTGPLSRVFGKELEKVGYRKGQFADYYSRLTGTA